MKQRAGLKLSFILLTIFWSGCGWMSADTPARDFAVHVDVSHGDTWHVKYKFSEPVNGIVFRRQMTQFRTATWRPLNSLIKVGQVQGYEALYSTGAPFSELELSITPYFNDTPRDYEFFVPFSDGSVALYTGHFDVRPLFCPGMRECAPGDLVEKGVSNVAMDFTFVPAPGEHVVLTDAPSPGGVNWKSEKEGRYVYFGNIPVQDGGAFKAVLDPHLPDWVKNHVTKALPQVLDLYTAKIGFNLEAKPMVLFSYVPAAAIVGTRGGVLHHQVRLSVFSRQWEEQTSENVSDLMELLSHELAHLWNGDLFFPAGGDGEAWMHEGSADAFAYRAMYTMQLINKNEFMDLQTKALNRCILGLTGISLRSSDQARRFRNYYTCGSIIALLTEAAVGRSSGADLFGFWNELFRNAALRGNSYTSQMYYSILNRRSDGEAGNIVSQLVETHLGQPDYFLNSALARYGVETEVTGERPYWYEAESHDYNSTNLFQFISIRNYNSPSLSF